MARELNPVRQTEYLDFVNLVSHELRGPTTVLRGYLSMWLEGVPTALPPELVPAARICYGRVLQLNNLINQIILAVRIHEGSLVADREPLDLARWLRQLAHDISLVVASTDHGLELELMPGAAVVDADPTLLRTALFNLLDNAQKFSPANSIVRLALIRTPTRQVIQVTDQGPGLPPDFEPRAFGRIDHEQGFERPGVGLGLFIARGVASAHNGELTFASSPGGNAVRIELPLREGIAPK